MIGPKILKVYVTNGDIAKENIVRYYEIGSLEILVFTVIVV